MKVPNCLTLWLCLKRKEMSIYWHITEKNKRHLKVLGSVMEVLGSCILEVGLRLLLDWRDGPGELLPSNIMSGLGFLVVEHCSYGCPPGTSLGSWFHLSARGFPGELNLSRYQLWEPPWWSKHLSFENDGGPCTPENLQFWRFFFLELSPDLCLNTSCLWPLDEVLLVESLLWYRVLFF